MSVEFASGKTCWLRPVCRKDLDGAWADWLNNPDVTRYMLQGAFPTTAEANRAFYDSITTSTTDLVLAIIWRDTREHVGNIGLHRIDPIHRTAELGILIGERRARGRGIGTEAVRLICRHGFNRLNLARIWLGVMADHHGAINCYKRAGFRLEGILRQDIARDGKRVDKLIMGLLPPELS